MTDLADRLRMALDITKDAAAVAMSHFRNSPDIATKSDQSPVTVADTQTEQAIRDGLARAFPSEAIFGEEFGRSGDSQDIWIIDPIDGTRSFITGLPLFGMLLGYLQGGQPQLGIIRMPALNEVYAGAVGQGARCNGAAIAVSDCKTLSTARLFVNEGDKLAAHEPQVFARLIHSGELRRMGADCYPHALVARGLVDAVVDYDLQPYDYLPVSAVVQAAGGVMTDWQGNPLTMESDGRTLTAATPELHAELLALVNA
ncbi:inositol monophosphatase family protein [Roseobacter sp. N2S]|uniref:inositol monophosphatase family protein n=1 Tax=Roseobacter sp. N2S TaxID=2663844 RepID=UPI0028612E68|nr:inositol monophosphatase family protein [Roseobacter sp. N2S]MDR6263504.1 histidinol phosphatase-like enzyme (inositol monophosphatase family) [Roseobacter sp. N2S]